MGRATIKHYLLIFIAFAANSFGQSISRPELCKPEVIRFSGNLYIAGYSEGPANNLDIVVHQLTNKLEPGKNSFRVSIGRYTCEKLYGVQIDTTHEYLNFVIQEINNDKTCRIIRLDKKLNLVANIDNAEISRVNTFTAQEKEYLYYHNDLYVVRPFSKDSANQFILQKYTLKDSSKIFEYNTLWQIPFSKQKYHRCHLVAANERFVYLFVNVLEGTKKGQWMLFIDPQKGEILHTERLNDNNENSVFLYGGQCYDKQTKEMSICGYMLPAKSIKPDYTGIDFSLPKGKTVPVFLCTFDSAGHASAKGGLHDFVSIPVELATEKEFKQFIFKVNKFQYYNHQYTFLYEILGGAEGKAVFKTCGLQYTTVDHNEENALQAKSNVFVNTYKDPKTKKVTGVFDLYNMDTKGNADEILYKPAVSGSFKDFNWNIQFGNEKVQGYSVLEKQKRSQTFGYKYSDKVWKIDEQFQLNTEINKVPETPVVCTFLSGLETFYFFKYSSYDPETRIGKGLEGSLLKLE